MSDKLVYKPSTVLRLVKAKAVSYSQPGTIQCHEHGHVIPGQTESPTFWENGSYCYCPVCKKLTLVKVEFADFVVDTSGERKVYPLSIEST